ncbi:Dabb family protein [Sodalis sp. dw_96]|uniref:Dabb family protein n=1 Tax=Sodalis sp. dw_96 TaxID=2719794 RepID=UPI001BD1CD8C|nr:Dabb family protein [Sodalis sp. dw_96]
MIQHDVLFRFKGTLSEEQVRRIAVALLTMDRFIPGIIKATWHENISREQHDKGFRHKVSLYFADHAALEDYLIHRHHLYVREHFIQPSLTDGVCSVLIFDALLTPGEDD